MNKKSGIYCIYNLINKKQYIGSSINLKKRKAKHLSTLKNNTHDNDYLQKSYNKYGSKNFLFVILEYVAPNQLIEREQYWINTIGFINLYNLRPIANSPLGTKQTQETKDKRRATYYQNGGNPNKKTVYQISLETKQIIHSWESASQAARELKIKHSHIIAVCNKKIKSYKGYFWSYTKDYVLPNILDYGESSKRSISQIDLKTGHILRTFSSITEASLETNIYRRNINFVCQGKRKSAGGYKWQYA